MFTLVLCWCRFAQASVNDTSFMRHHERSVVIPRLLSGDQTGQCRALGEIMVHSCGDTTTDMWVVSRRWVSCSTSFPCITLRKCHNGRITRVPEDGRLILLNLDLVTRSETAPESTGTKNGPSEGSRYVHFGARPKVKVNYAQSKMPVWSLRT